MDAKQAQIAKAIAEKTVKAIIDDVKKVEVGAEVKALTPTSIICSIACAAGCAAACAATGGAGSAIGGSVANALASSL